MSSWKVWAPPPGSSRRNEAAGPRPRPHRHRSWCCGHWCCWSSPGASASAAAPRSPPPPTEGEERSCLETWSPGWCDRTEVRGQTELWSQSVFRSWPSPDHMPRWLSVPGELRTSPRWRYVSPGQWPGKEQKREYLCRFISNCTLLPPADSHRIWASTEFNTHCSHKHTVPPSLMSSTWGTHGFYKNICN